MPKPYKPNDELARLAKAEGYRARSVYKLMELDNKFHLLKPGLIVLDLGASPGSWLQYTSEKIGASGKALGLDLMQIKNIAENIVTKVCDITDLEKVGKRISETGFEKFDLILSDLAPSTSGIPYKDQAESLELNKAVFEIAKIYLKPNGKVVMKIFESNLIHPFIKELKSYFRNVTIFHSSATRSSSNEVYIVCS